MGTNLLGIIHQGQGEIQVGFSDALTTEECATIEAKRISPCSVLPKEIMLKIFGDLDSTALCRAAQVSTRWKDLADDDMLWRRMCKHHGYRPKPSETKPWKVVYRDRMVVELNWRCGRFTTRTLTGHTHGVTCLQFNETLSNPSFPVLISGSNDSTVRVWNMDTGVELHCLKGHTSVVCALQFDEVKLITGGWDKTLKVWDWRSGECIRTLRGHFAGVTCLNFAENLLASSGWDKSIKIWDLGSGSVFTLNGHSTLVKALQLWDSNLSTVGCTFSEGPSLLTSTLIKPGMLLFSAAMDDGAIKLWDLNDRTCIRNFLGHGSTLLCMTLLLAGDGEEEDDENERENSLRCEQRLSQKNPLVRKRKKPLLISGGSDQKVKVWDTETGQITKTYLGHTHAVVSVACDNKRLVSGGYDETIHIRRTDSGECIGRLTGHQSEINCLALSEDKVVSGSGDHTIKIYSFTTRSGSSESQSTSYSCTHCKPLSS